MNSQREDDPWCQWSQGHCWAFRMPSHRLAALKPEQQRGLKCGHDPTEGVLLCGQTRVTGSRRGSERLGRNDRRAAGSTSIQRQSKAHHSDGGRALIHLVLMAHLLCSLYDSPYSPLTSATSRHMKHLKKHFYLVLWNWIFEKAKKQPVDTLYMDGGYIMSTSFLLLRFLS